MYVFFLTIYNRVLPQFLAKVQSSRKGFEPNLLAYVATI